MPTDSNILSFASMFEMVDKVRSNDIIRRVIRWDATKENLNEITPNGSLAIKIKQAILSGEEFYEYLGVIKK